MSQNNTINTESGSKAVGIETLTIDWTNEGFKREAEKSENDLSGTGR